MVVFKFKQQVLGTFTTLVIMPQCQKDQNIDKECGSNAGMMVQGGDMQGSMWGAQSAHYLVNEVH